MSEFNFKHPPLKHQMEDWLRSREMYGFALWHEMGCGKSKIVVDTMGWLYQQGLIDTVLILSRKGLYANWHRTEIPEHMNPDIEYVSAVYRSGLGTDEKRAIRTVADTRDKLRILSVNVESLRIDERKRFTSEGGKVAAGFLKTQSLGAMVVVDESTCVKSYRNTTAKAVYELAARCRYRRILTGTPVPRSPLDVWGQVLVLGKGTLHCRTFTEFRAMYAVVETVTRGSRSFPQVTGYQRLDQLQGEIKCFGSIRERADCVDLPKKIYTKVAVSLTPQQKELYTQMRDEALMELGDGTVIEAVNALGIISRLDQVACGQVKRPDGTFEILDSDRPDTLVALMEQTDRRQIVWCSYRGLCEHLYDRLRQEFGDKAIGRYYGEVSDDERERVVRGFQDPDADVRYIVANQASMGYGLTLTRGKANWYYANGYNLEHRLQSEDRTMRIGQDEQVLYGDFYSPDTVNEKIYANLRDKKSLAQQVLGTRITDWI